MTLYIVKQISDRVCVMEKGKIVEQNQTSKYSVNQNIIILKSLLTQNQPKKNY